MGRGTGWRAVVGVMGGCALAPLAAGAYEAEFGDVAVTLVTSLSVGAQMRMEDRSPRNVCVANGGQYPTTSCNTDDGNLNFDKGDVVSTPARVSSELTATWANFGVYVRGTALYDAILDNNDLAVNGPATRDYRGALAPTARDAAAKTIELQDAYVKGSFQVFGSTLNVRLGQQTIIWGEALVTQNGINVINPLDVAKIRVPGAELRDALIPVPALFASYNLGDGLSAEAFYQFKFRPFRLEVPGTYFSTNDFVGQGGRGVGVGGDYDDMAPDGTLLSIPRHEDERPDDAWENFGAALRYYSPALNDTEFGLYYIRYTSRTPVPVFTAPSGSDYQRLPPGVPALLSPFIPEGGVGAGGGSPLQDIIGQLPGLSPLAPLQANARNSKVVNTYPTGIDAFGVSFNTKLEATGTALNGEVSYKLDVPVVVEETTVISDFINGLSELPLAGPTQLGTNVNRPGLVSSTGRPHDVLTFILRATQFFTQTDLIPRLLGAAGGTLVAEAGLIHVDIPDASVLAYDAPGTYRTPGTGQPEDGLKFKEDYATAWSGGLTTLLQVAYPDVMPNLNLTTGFAHTIGLGGNTPLPGGFVEHVNSLNFFVQFDYLIDWRLQVNYAMSFGGGRQNITSDRDFVGVSLSYQF
ncbi:DUF1302 domain-containing protein [Oleomonas cavernae]|uniref:DUF1302 domain-containing protein n=1 Tax=Oleomonas cavernae TaxID=2320859 RepID=A0A418WD79_9PROT|nr:DUF1302 domain-containing protein [Oleomonas cavernae]RJF87918.1 DUF1302 domain-containing protein [Oleomonas cavernae]